MAGAEVRIDGLDEFRRAVDAVDVSAAAQLAFGTVADLVADDARPRVPRRSGAARASVGVKSTSAGATVSGGGPRASYFGWLDFGGAVGIRGSVRRPYLKTGRYIFRSLAGVEGRIDEVMADALAGELRRAGLEVD